MKCICAISPCGFMAQGPNDDMKWTPKVDKQIFQLITSLTGGVCFVSKATKQMMPAVLTGRTLVEVSRNGLTLETAAKKFPEGVIIGGPEMLRVAITKNLITDLIVNTVQFIKPSVFMNTDEKYRFPFDLMHGIISHRVMTIDWGAVHTQVFRLGVHDKW